MSEPIVFSDPATMRAWSHRQRAAGRRVGVVPTLGALHDGHLSLIRLALASCDRVIVTIFVNPLQFNQEADFDLYPRPIDDDLRICAEAGVDAVYAPTSTTMYPAGFQTHVEPGDLADRLEGPMRPGHFRGVTTVVTKLFGATAPHLAVFGQKDFQQLAIIRQMVSDLDLGIEIIAAPTARADDGLALSSRNVRLPPDDRAAAVVLSQALAAAAAAHRDGMVGAADLIAMVTDRIAAEPRAKVEYVECVDARTLEAIETVERDAVLLLAAWFGEVRLIDNRVLTAT